MFLSQDEVAQLTGRKRKACQIAALRTMGIAFFVNACGRPVVLKSAVEGRAPADTGKQWVPAALKTAA